MATASTKRNRKKARADSGAASPASQKRQASEEFGRRGPSAPEPAFDIPERAWLYAGAAVLLLALLLRVYALDMKPLHHDEGVNGFFLTNLLRQGRYAYDPENYHGPTLYYLTLPFAALAGLHTFLIRLVPSLFGVGVVWLVLALRRYVGTVAALAAALLVAVSPACVFYSRYFIHETPFVFFTLGLVVSALRFRETGAASELLLASASAALMFATKETAFISVGTLGLAWLTAALWERLRGGGRGRRARAASGSEGGGF
ncbi:MAG TPA: flippase activity-associated protein Agl23, partial [Pyrinomonadaceae bacterium]